MTLRVARRFMGLLRGAAFLGLQAFGMSVAWAQGTVPDALPVSTQVPVAIAVDLNKMVGPYQPAYGWFGYDEANYTTMRHGKELLAELHELSPTPVSIRVHHLLTSGNGVAELKFSSTNVYSEDANGKPIYNCRRAAHGGTRLYARSPGRRPAEQA
jgi:xylan 1,4-beta-xylosidase